MGGMPGGKDHHYEVPGCKTKTVLQYICWGLERKLSRFRCHSEVQFIIHVIDMFFCLLEVRAKNNVLFLHNILIERKQTRTITCRKRLGQGDGIEGNRFQLRKIINRS